MKPYKKIFKEQNEINWQEVEKFWKKMGIGAEKTAEKNIREFSNDVNKKDFEKAVKLIDSGRKLRGGSPELKVFKDGEFFIIFSDGELMDKTENINIVLVFLIVFAGDNGSPLKYIK